MEGEGDQREEMQGQARKTRSGGREAWAMGKKEKRVGGQGEDGWQEGRGVC